MDEDIAKHINDYNKIHQTAGARAMAEFLTAETEQTAKTIAVAYNIGEEEGTKIVSSLLTALILVNSKDVDETLQRLDAIYKDTKEGLIILDKEMNMGK